MLLTVIMIIIAYIIKIVIILIGDMTENVATKICFIIACTISDAIILAIFLNMEFYLLWRGDLIYLICDFGFSTILYLIFHVYDLDKK